MALEKLEHFTKKVSDLADKPNATMTAAEVKAQFDAAPDEVRVYLNQLIDTLQSNVDGDSGADNIKVTPLDPSHDNVQGALEWLHSQIGAATTGQIADGSLVDSKLSNQPGDIKARFNNHQIEKNVHGIGDKQTLKTTHKDTLVGSINELFQSANNGKTAVANAITEKGVSSSPADTFAVLATKIGQINTGKKWASGVTKSSASKNELTVTGLTFKPSIIVASLTTPTDYYRASVTVATSGSGRDYVKAYSNSLIDSVNTFSLIDGWGGTYYTETPISETGFTIKVNGMNMDFNWIAFE